MPKNSELLAELEERIAACRRCPRLVAWRERVGREKRRAFRSEAYWARPVPGFGDPQARVLVVGLAPGAHGSNRTGRMFTGDASGDFLFPALHRAGYADRPRSVARDDGLALRGMFITAVVRCVPPGNKPAPDEIRNCAPFLAGEIRLLERVRVVVALGGIAYNGLIRGGFGGMADPEALRRHPPFAHGISWRIPRQGGAHPIWMLASYHPSRQNTQTGRLTRAMFDSIWRKARDLSENALPAR
jgi:uracil-DNA glycosylase family 4